MRKSARTQIPPFFDNDPYILKDFRNAPHAKMLIYCQKNIF